MPTLSIVTSTHAGIVTIRPTGEIDSDNAHEVRDEVSALLATAAPAAITVDMSAVSFIDSVGIGALVGCYHAAAARSIPLTVVNPTSYVHRILYISGLLGLFGSPARQPDRPVQRVANPVS